MAVAHHGAFRGLPAPIYADHLVPVDTDPGDRPCIVMLHGGSHTGSCFLLTADGRPGWAPYVAERGYHVVVPDWPGHGRSGGARLTDLTGELLCEAMAAMITDLATPVVLLAHSMAAAFAWRIAELCRGTLVALVAVAAAPPGNLQDPARVHSEDGDAIVVRTSSRLVTIPRGEWSRATPELIERKLIGSSTRFPREHAVTYANLLTPTSARLVYERLNVAGSQLRVRDPSRLDGLPVVLLTGSADVDHPRETEQALAEWLEGQGARVDFVWLAAREIHGNGHMVMMESNSDAIADVILERLDVALAT